MFSLNVKSNIAEALREFRSEQANLPLATAKALTFTAERVREAERAEIQRVFDRPTRFTSSSLFLQSATPARLTARVYFKDLYDGDPWHYLVPQVEGGQRRLKQFEKYLQSAGWLPKDQFVVPGERAKLDAYGNISRGQIIQVLSALRALPQQGYLANRSARSAARKKRAGKLIEYFVGRPKPSAPDGVWQRVGTGLRPILIFVKAPRYKARFAFYEIANRTADREFGPLLDRALQRERERVGVRIAA